MMKQLVLIALALSLGCGGGSTTLTPTSPASGLGAPGIEGPSNDLPVDSTRPQLVIRNAQPTPGGGGARSYEVQIASTAAFTSIAWTSTVAEGAGDRTVVNVDQDLTPESPYVWRARLVQDGKTSDWSPSASFRSGIEAYNRAGELWDPLTNGSTVGTTIGPVSFLPGRGIRLESESSYVRYLLPETISSGEFSMIVEGLQPNGPNHKLKIFSMSDGPGNFIGSRFEAAAHYRGVNGNPDNAISMKVVWGSSTFILEPDRAFREASVRHLNASTSYFWQGSWNSNSFRLMVREGDANGGVLHDRTYAVPASAGFYAPSPHYAYLGANSGQFGSDAGTWPGMIIRNVWLGNRARPR